MSKMTVEQAIGVMLRKYDGNGNSDKEWSEFDQAIDVLHAVARVHNLDVTLSTMEKRSIGLTDEFTPEWEEYNGVKKNRKEAFQKLRNLEECGPPTAAKCLRG